MSVNWLQNYRNGYLLKYYEYFPPHVRQFIQTKDHRYLLLFDVDNSPYKLHDEQTKKSLY
jgi:hypothetical protein